MWKSRKKAGANGKQTNNNGVKRFVALARVSSREQEREGWSLEVQEEQLQAYAKSKGGVIVKPFKIAETASRTEERKTFKELIRYARQNRATIDGILFYGSSPKRVGEFL